jgi:tRNA dimethylallyltransferase
MAQFPVVLLMGPTASGKSALAMALAERFPVEIISVDSAQVYRGMDIGTAKPSAEERARVPHHLIDILEPVQSYSAARFVRDAEQLIGEIRGRLRLPLLVGGTMLYLRSLLHGLSDLPPADAGLRAAIEKEAKAEGWPALHARLASKDPVTAARLSPNDGQRIQRALEIIELSGESPTTHFQQRRPPQIDGPVLKFALGFADRAELHRRIERRLHQMMAAGLLEEVRALRDRGDLNADLPSMRSVGYRQLWRHLDGVYGLDEAVERAISASRQLAKRQLTWLRSEEGATHLDATAASLAEPVVGRIHAAVIP